MCTFKTLYYCIAPLLINLFLYFYAMYLSNPTNSSKMSKLVKTSTMKNLRLAIFVYKCSHFNSMIKDVI